jgi:hypothetical protein
MINQLGFMVVGVSIGGALGISGAAAHAFADIFFEGLLFMSMGALLTRVGTIPFFAFFAHAAGHRVPEAPVNMRVAMALAAAISTTIGVAPELLYGILPFAVDYEPYTTAHVINQVQLLAWAAMAFTVLQVTGLSTRAALGEPGCGRGLPPAAACALAARAVGRGFRARSAAARRAHRPRCDRHPRQPTVARGRLAGVVLVDQRHGAMGSTPPWNRAADLVPVISAECATGVFSDSRATSRIDVPCGE